MNTLKRFGSGSRLYTFPVGSQITYEDDFDKLANKIIRLAGANGGYRNMGTGRGQSVGGTVKADLWLTFNDYVEATDKVNSLRQMASWGMMPLFRQPLYGPEQFCWGVFNSASLRQDVKAVPHVRQRIPMVFEVPDPFWHTAGTELLWGSGWKWGDGSKWGGGSTAAAPTNISGNGTITLTVGGTEFTFGRLIISNASGANATNIIIRRLEGGRITDEVRWTGTLATGQQLYIDRRRYRVRRGPTATDAMADFDFINPDWLRLYPGSNTLKVYIDGAADVSVRWLERYI